MTECTQQTFGFQGHKKRRVEACFDGGHVTSDAGLVLVRELVNRIGTVRRFAECFKDYRNPGLIEHTVEELLLQRVVGLAAGYEDLNDHDTLRTDPVFALVAGKSDLEGEARRRQEDRGKPLAGKSTLNRLELTPRRVAEDERYKKIECDEFKVGEFWLEEFSRSRRGKVRRLILDLDRTGFPLHGNQEGRHFLSYYDEYVYFPLYIFCDDMPLVARLQTGDRAAWNGVASELAYLIPRLRQRFPGVRIVVRGDSAFAVEQIMGFCEEIGVDYVFGLPKNPTLERELEGTMSRAEKAFKNTQTTSKEFCEFHYKTRETWSKERRVIGKAEFGSNGPNPRFVVTSLSRRAGRAIRMYEEWYCQRCDMENRIKEQLQLFADRMSVHVKRANQLRMWFSTVAYIILAHLRRFALTGTTLARAEAATIRLRLLKIGARVTISARRIYFSMASAFPLQQVFAAAHRNLLRI